MGALRVCVSASAADRLSCARDVIRSCAPGTRVLIVGASRGAADDLAREVAASVPATFGLQRLSLTQLAAKTAILSLGLGGRDHEHVARHRSGRGARGIRCHARSGRSTYFGPVSSTPGFPRALARTLQELRLAGVAGRSYTGLPLAGRDLADLLDRVEASFAAASSADRAQLFRAAARAAATSPVADVVVLLDLAYRACRRARVGRRGHRRRAVIRWRRYQPAITTVSRSSCSVGGVVEERGADGNDDLACLRRFLFTRRGPAG